MGETLERFLKELMEKGIIGFNLEVIDLEGDTIITIYPVNNKAKTRNYRVDGNILHRVSFWVDDE